MNEDLMASITIRNLSAESKERLRRTARQRGCSLEALARSILDAAARDATHDTTAAAGFPYDLISMVEPGEDIEPFLEDHDHPQAHLNLQ